jgi:hypothetical protein
MPAKADRLGAMALGSPKRAACDECSDPIGIIASVREQHRSSRNASSRRLFDCSGTRSNKPRQRRVAQLPYVALTFASGDNNPRRYSVLNDLCWLSGGMKRPARGVERRAHSRRSSIIKYAAWNEWKD